MTMTTLRPHPPVNIPSPQLIQSVIYFRPTGPHYLTAEQVYRICYLLATTDMLIESIAHRFGVRKSAVSKINRRFNIRHPSHRAKG